MHLGNVIIFLIYITMNSEARVIKFKSFGDSWLPGAALRYNLSPVFNLQYTSDIIS